MKTLEQIIHNLAVLRWHRNMSGEDSRVDSYLAANIFEVDPNWLDEEIHQKFIDLQNQYYETRIEPKRK